MLTPELKITLQGLIHIRDNGPLKPKAGICCNLEYATKQMVVEWSRFEFLNNQYEWLAVMGEQWPLFSGSRAYPVPTSANPEYRQSPGHAYLLTTDLWDTATEYGRLRREYLDWLIARLTEQQEAI